MDGDTITLYAVGDVMVNQEEPEALFADVRSTLCSGDIVFGNCETPYSDRGSPALRPTGGAAIRSHPKGVAGLRYAGFHVMSFANNHSLDWGYDAFFDTLSLLREHGIAPVGAGEDLKAARTPVVVERKGNRVAFLAYAPVTWAGNEAGEGKPGCPPLRIYTVYREVERHQPGSVPDILTFADPGDLAMMQDDVRRAKSQAQVVAVSFHWGIHFTPSVLATYESEVGRAAIDAGADLVLGHHQHILKGVQVYRGKVIFHGLGNFAASPIRGRSVSKATMEEIRRRYGEHLGHPDSHLTMIAKATISQGRVLRVSFLPCVVNAKGAPEVCPPGTDGFLRVSSYMSQVTKEAGLSTEFDVQGDEVVVKT